jgi:hypothetical protein
MRPPWNCWEKWLFFLKTFILFSRFWFGLVFLVLFWFQLNTNQNKPNQTTFNQYAESYMPEGMASYTCVCWWWWWMLVVVVDAGGGVSVNQPILQLGEHSSR